MTANTFFNKILYSVLGVIIALTALKFPSLNFQRTDILEASENLYKEQVEEIAYDEEGEAPLMYLIVQANTLNVRDDVMGNKIGKTHKDERYFIFGEKNGWYLIQISDQMAGYVCGKYVNTYNPDGSLYMLASAYNKDPIPANKEEYADPLFTTAIALMDPNVVNAITNPTTPEQPTDPNAITDPNTIVPAVADPNAVIVPEIPQPVPAVPVAPQPWETKAWTDLTKDELIMWAICASGVTADMSNYDKCIAVNNFLCNHMTYDLSYYTTVDAIRLGRGRCQGYANAFKDIMNTLGVPTDYVRGYSNGGNHGWNRVLIDGVYYYIDVTWNDSTGTNQWLMISEAQMSIDHIVRQYSAQNTQ